MFGFLNVNKPKGMTSHDVVAKLRRILKIKQIGHAGTLDPLASGVLPIAVGKSTRLIEYFSDEKAYKVTLALCKTSNTCDVEGEIVDHPFKFVSEEEFCAATKEFIGDITQIPPAHSAVHYNGKRLYELARKGIIPDDIPARKVAVSKIVVDSFNCEKGLAVLDIDCSKGTYIRSIVRDLGNVLGVGAVMTDLVRTASSSFALSNSLCLTPDLDYSFLQNSLINPLEVLSYNQKTLSVEELQKVKNGQSLSGNCYNASELISLTYEGKLVAIAESDNEFLKIKKVFL